MEFGGGINRLACTSRQCIYYNQSGFSEIRGGDTYCTGCGKIIASDNRLENELEFESGGRAHGKFIHNGRNNGKLKEGFALS